MTKVCSKCFEEKAETDFYLKSKTTLRRRPDCKNCVKKRHSDKYPLNKKRIFLKQKVWRELNKSNNKISNIYFENVHCKYCNVLLDLNNVHLSFSTKTGFRNFCKVCHKIKARNYDITTEQYYTLYDEQKGKCALCPMHFQSYFDSNVCIDHNHLNQKIRGLLCRICNIRLAGYEKRKLIFEEYLCKTQ